jgi:hypothetical protein
MVYMDFIMTGWENATPPGERWRSQILWTFSAYLSLYNSIIKTDTGPASDSCGGLNCYTRRMYFKDA